MNRLAEFLVKAKAVIDTPEKWTTGFLARDSRGLPCAVISSEATCFCSLGAVGKVEAEYLKQVTTAYEVLDLSLLAAATLRGAITEQAPHGSIGLFNDTVATHGELMEVWDRAIEIASTRDRL